MDGWNQQAVFEQNERIEHQEQQVKKYEQYFIIGGIIIAAGVILYHFRDLCPLYLKNNDWIDVNSFITPNDPAIITVALQLQQQLSLQASSEEKIRAALEFTHSNIRYISDREQFGISEYWTFPAETLENGAGDCEDISFTIASILLALNLPSGRVRVALGVKDSIGHAWCEVLLNDEWFILEGARGTMIPKYEANGYSVDCYVYKNKCETLNSARYGLHNLLDPLEALSSLHSDSSIASDATKANGDGYITDMYNLIAETARDTRERTFSFCSNNGITTTDTNIGNADEVYLVECREGKKVGDFHTHLNTTQFSVADIINLASQKNGFSCVGAASNNKIACLEVNRTEEGFEQWEQRLYESAVEPLELREWLAYSQDLTTRQWLNLYCEYETALTTFESIITEGMWKGYLVDSTVELLRELSLP